MDSSVSPKDEIRFLRVCHHISNAVYSPVPSYVTPRGMPSRPALCGQHTFPLSTDAVHAISNKETFTYHLRVPCERSSHTGLWVGETVHHARSNCSRNKDKTCSSSESFHTFPLNLSSFWYRFIKCSL
jgi:hypothetical protein